MTDTTPSNVSKLTTAKRVYTIRLKEDGTASASYEPINPKTGKPWQAARCLGGTVLVFSNHKTGDKEIRPGTAYPRTGDIFENGRWKSILLTFANSSDAFKAVYEDAAKRNEEIELI